MQRLRFDLYARIALSVTLLIAVAMFVLANYLVSDAREKFNQERLQQITASAKTLANGSRDALVSEDYERLGFWLNSSLVSDYYAYAYLSRVDGIILSHTDLGMTAKQSTPLGALQQVYKRQLQYQGRPVMEVVYPSLLGENHLANAHVAYFLDQGNFSDIYNITNVLILVSVLLGVLWFAILFIVRYLTVPVRRLTGYATHLSFEDIHTKLDADLLKDRSEVGELARAFDSMAMRLGQAYRELKKEEVTLKELVDDRTRDLLEVNKELEAFSHSVSHDLRAPLRTIDGFVQILQEDYESLLDDTGRDYMHRIRGGVERMNDLIGDMLQLSQISRQELDLHYFDISKLVQTVADILWAGDRQRDADLIIEENLSVEADGQLLRIVIENLLSNAWKYTGKVEHAVIEFGMQKQGNEEVYFVRDNGTGFDMKYADDLFVVFKRLHSVDEFEGTGVGLATVDRIIRRHGGRIWAHAEPGKGATFYFVLRPGVRMVMSN